MAPSLSFNNLDQRPKKQHVKKKKNQTEDTAVNETGLSLSFERDDKPHLVEDMGDSCLEFSFYAQQFHKSSRVDPSPGPCVLRLLASQRVSGRE